MEQTKIPPPEIDTPRKQIEARRGRDTLHFLSSIRGLLALVIVLVVGAFYSPKTIDGWPIFLTLGTQTDILYEFSQIGLLATGMTFVILMGGIDLSVGSVMGLVAMLFSLLYIKLGWDPSLAAAAAVAAGASCGAINGIMISKLKLQPFVATLAMMAAARGGAQLLTNSKSIVPGPNMAFGAGTDIPFYTWLNSSLLNTGIRPMTMVFIVTIIAGFLIIKYTKFGRQIYAIGGNEEASRLSGISVDRVKITAYAVCGLTAALAGICDAAKQGYGFPQAGLNYELDAIAAVVIGGTSLMGGTGSMLLTLLGTILIADITKILSLNNVPPASRLIAKGGLIVAAVLLQHRRTKS